MSGPTLSMHSASVPALAAGEAYDIKVDQRIVYNDSTNATQTKSLPTLQQTFVTSESSLRYALPKSKVYSVYPPQAHIAPWNVLPFVTWSDAQLPWIIRCTDVSQKPGIDVPWLALLTFTEEELRPQPSFLETELPQCLGDANRKLNTTSTFAVPMKAADFEKYTQTGSASPPIADTQAIFLTPTLYSSLFATSTQHQALTHVRSVDKDRLSNLPGDHSGNFAVTLSSRVAPWTPRAPTKIFAHIVALPTKWPAQKSGSLNAVVSLHSWVYVSQPNPSGFSLWQSSLALEQSFRPLSILPKNIEKVDAQDRDKELKIWTRARLQAGYCFAPWIAPSGEQLACIYRGMLIPLYELTTDLPPSDDGDDLVIIDGTADVPDFTYQLAWELGRTLLMSNLQVAGALLRLRGAMHHTCILETKTELASKEKGSDGHGQAFKAISAAIPAMTEGVSLIKDRADVKSGIKANQRWQPAETLPSLRTVHSILANNSLKEYDKRIGPITSKLTKFDPPESGTHHEVPNSTDFATLFQWVVDRWNMRGIPWHNLVVDPAQIPAETARSFFIDPVWFRAFIDGALSLGEQFTHADHVRECLKSCLQDRLAQKGAPRVPCCGVLMRSELLARFPDIRIDAPGGDILRSEIIDGHNTLLLLFDRMLTTANFPKGITFATPDHQLCFSFGSPSEWKIDSKGMCSISLSWNKVNINGTAWSPKHTTSTFSSNSSSVQGFDFKTRLIEPISLKKEISNALGASEDLISPAVVAVQLLSDNPTFKLNIADQTGVPAQPDRKLVSSVSRADCGMPVDEVIVTPPKRNVASPSTESDVGIPVPGLIHPFLRDILKLHFTDEGIVRSHLTVNPDNKSIIGSKWSLEVYNAQSYFKDVINLPQNIMGRTVFAIRPWEQSLRTDLYFDVDMSGNPGLASGSLRIELTAGDDASKHMIHPTWTQYGPSRESKIGIPTLRFQGRYATFWSGRVRCIDEQVKIELETRQGFDLHRFVRFTTSVKFVLEGVLLNWVDPGDGKGAKRYGINAWVSGTGASGPGITLTETTDPTAGVNVFAVDAANEYRIMGMK